MNKKPTYKELEKRIISLEEESIRGKQTEEALAASQIQLSDAMDLARIVYWNVDPTTGDFIFNDPFYAFYGTTAESEGGYRMTREEYGKRFVHPDDMWLFTEAKEKRERSQEREFLHDLEHRIIRRDGKVRHILARIHLTKDADGRVIKYYGANQDITERKRVEEALAESELKYRSLFKSMGQGFYLSQILYDENGIPYDFRYIDVNSAFEQIIGLKKEQIIGKTYNELVPPDPESGWLDCFKRVATTGIPENYTFTSKIYKSYFEVYAFKPEEGKFCALVKDITDRKLAEEELQKSYALLKSVIESSKDVVIFALDRQYRYIAFNENHRQTMKRIWGMDIALGKSMLEYIKNPEDCLKAKNNFDRALSGESFTLAEAYGDTALERRYYEDIYNPIIDGNGDVIGLTLFLIDITERRQAEEEKRRLEERLLRAEKMEALGTLAGGVAHDLNNVLGIVVGYSELLLNEIDDSSSIRPRLVNIMKGGVRAAAIVQDLLTLARRGVSGRKVLNLNKIITDCQQSPEFKNLSSDHSFVQIKTDLESDLLNISGSSVHLGKTLFNLVSNAFEAMPKGGLLTIKTANQYLDKPIQGYDEVREGDYVVLSVSDTGEGIAAADMKRIFEPFYTKKVMGRSGTGLGLAVVWGTVKDHYGYINVQSEEGKGSTFTLYFPVTRGDISSEAVAVAISEYMGRGESILVVDDVKGQRDLATDMLRRLNYNVANVSSGEEAVEYLKEHQVDLIVLDMIMDPGMDGLDTYRSILEIHREQKAIIVSGFSETYRVNATQALGAGAYVRKPYILEKLGMAVKKELDRK